MRHLFFSCLYLPVTLAFTSPMDPLPCPLIYEKNAVIFPYKADIFIENIPSSHIASHPLRLFSYIHKNHSLIEPEITFDGLTLVFLEAPQTRCFIKHYFHLLEHVVGSWCCHASKHRDQVKNILILSDGHYRLRSWKGPHQMNEHLLQALFPHATVWTPHDLVKTFKRSSIRLEEALFSDRLISFSNPLCIKTSKMLAEVLDYISPDQIEELSTCLRKYFDIQRVPSEKLRITYVVRRDPPRFMQPILERKLMRHLAKIPGVIAQAVDFASISYREQINLVNHTDVLLGIHGNGLSHLLFLPKNASVIELFPPDAQALDYRLYADAKKIRYYGVICDQGIKERSWAYEHGMFGQLNTEIKELDLDLLVGIVKKELVIQSPRSF